jgi:1,4-alpha-glucan branching enzyme
VESHLDEAGFRYFFIDTHMAEAGESLGAYGDVPHGVERFDAAWSGEDRVEGRERVRSAYRAYLVDSADEGSPVAAFVREPRSSMQVWSRHRGYPGEARYLEFHKIRWPGGLKFWRVTGPDVDLGGKEPYDPGQAMERVRDHADHFAHLLDRIRQEEDVEREGLTVAPFDTELFGHWWYEGVRFLQSMYLRLPALPEVVPVTASEHLTAVAPQHRIRPLTGSWGADGDFSMWLNDETRWTWERLWPLEEAFWDAAAEALVAPGKEEIVAQAARQLLLAQSSDWQFMISTGAVPDYAEQRFNLHCDDARVLVDAMDDDAPESRVAHAREKARELEERDRLFPGVLDSVRQVLGRTTAP